MVIEIKIKSIMILLGLFIVLCSYSALGQLASQQPQTASVTVACAEDWQCGEWGACYNGISERACYDANLCRTEINMPSEDSPCQDVLSLCYDGNINQDETDADCGGKTCDKCGLGKYCTRNDDCFEGLCTGSKCSLEQVQPAAAQPSARPAASNYNIVLGITAVLLAIAVIFVIMAIMKKLKRQKIIVIVNKKEDIKEEIQISKMKKHRISKFVNNFNSYLKSMKPESKAVIKETVQKHLLNEKASERQAHPAKDFVLNSLREVYDEQ